jgi:hypothetical protein
MKSLLAFLFGLTNGDTIISALKQAHPSIFYEIAGHAVKGSEEIIMKGCIAKLKELKEYKDVNIYENEQVVNNPFVKSNILRISFEITKTQINNSAKTNVYKNVYKGELNDYKL